MTFSSQLTSERNHIVNIVARITTDSGDVYFSKREVQSGLVVDDNKKRLLSQVIVPPTTIDLKRSRQSIAPTKLKLIDKDEVFSSFMGKSVTALASLPIKIWVGLITVEGFDFSEYIEIGDFTIGNVSTSGTFFDIECRPPESLLSVPIYNIKGNLNSSITDTATSVDVITDGDIFPASGRAKIGEEFVQYTSKVFLTGITTLSGLSRGDLTSGATSHNAGTSCTFVEKVLDNPINILLGLITSTGTGLNGAYDTLKDGAGVDVAKVDVATFEYIRDTFFNTDTFTLYLYDIEDSLKYIQTELMQANNLRLVDNNGKISISILDQSDPNATLDIIDQKVIYNKSDPSWSMTQNSIVNSVEVLFNYNEGSQSYSRTITRTDSTSIARYGIKKGETLRFKGIVAEDIAVDRARRYLSRFSTPQVTIKTSEYLSSYNQVLGSKVNLRHDDLPGLGSGRGLDAEVEVLKRAIDFATGTVKKDYVFTSYANLRRGRIAPTSIISNVISLKNFEVDSVSSWLVGYKVRLYNPATKTFGTQVNEITAISGNQISVLDDFIGNTIGLKLVFPEYNDQAVAQRARYMSIVGPSGLFANGDGGFRIY